MNPFGAGRVILLSGGQVGKQHLFFCLSDTGLMPGHVITVMMVSAQKHTEKTTVIMPGDHPWVRHESTIDYGTARSVPISKLASAVKQNRLTLEKDASPELLARLREGVINSSETPNDIRIHCEKLFAPKKKP